MHWPSLARAAGQTRLPNVLAASLVVVAGSTMLIWQQPTAVVLAKSKVPFRFMEATILETQAALTRAPSPRRNSFRCTSPASRRMTRPVPPSTP